MTNEMDILLEIVSESDEAILQRQIQESWEKVYAARQNNSIMKAEIKGFETINGKYCGIVMIGDIKGIIPFELSGCEKKNEFRDLAGQEVVFKVVALDRQGETFVGSRKDAVEHQQGLTWDMLRTGQKVMGRVIRASKRYLHLDIGGIEVRLGKEDLSYEYLDDVQERYTIGEKIMVRVMEVDKKEKILKVSARALQPNPWPDCTKRFLVKSEYVGKVTGLVEYGVYVNLDKGVDCLTAQPSHKVGQVKKGDKVIVKIVDIKPQEQKITAKIIRKL